MLRNCRDTAPSMLTRAPTRTSRHRRESTLKGPCRGNRNLICFTICFLSKQLLRFTPHAYLLPDPCFCARRLCIHWNHTFLLPLAKVCHINIVAPGSHILSYAGAPQLCFDNTAQSKHRKLKGHCFRSHATQKIQWMLFPCHATKNPNHFILPRRSFPSLLRL